MNKRKGPRFEIFIVAGLLVFFIYTLVNQQALYNEKKANLEKIQTKIEEETRLNEKLAKEKEEVNSDEYIRKVAREKLGMVNQGEKVFIDVNN